MIFICSNNIRTPERRESLDARQSPTVCLSHAFENESAHFASGWIWYSARSFDPDRVSRDIGAHRSSAILVPGNWHRDVREGSFSLPYPLFLETNRPLDATTPLTKGLRFDMPTEPTQAAEGWLDQYYTLLNSEHLVHDPVAKWKKRFAPQTGRLNGELKSGHTRALIKIERWNKQSPDFLPCGLRELIFRLAGLVCCASMEVRLPADLPQGTSLCEVEKIC